MTIQKCNKNYYYKRSHWEDLYVKFDPISRKWVYNNLTPIGPVVLVVSDLLRCNSDGKVLYQVPIAVPYESNLPYIMVECKFKNSDVKYTYKAPADITLEHGQPLIVEKVNELSIVTYCGTVTTSTYPEDKLAWIWGTVNTIRNKKDSEISNIISSLVNASIQ